MKVIYFLIFCTWVLVACTINYDVLSLGLEKDLLIDASLLLCTITAVLSVISITFEISKELKNGVASSMLSKPLGRTHYLLGKLLGNIEVGFVLTFLVAIGSLAILHLAFPGNVTTTLIQSYLLILFSIIPMSSIAVLFALLLPDVIAPIATAIIIWLTFSTGIFSNVPVLYAGIIPDLELFNLKGAATYGFAIPWSYVLLALITGICYAVFASTLASYIFTHKDIH